MSVAKLFDTVQDRLQIRTDAAVADALGLQAAHISKMRNERLPLSDTAILRIHERLKLPVEKIRELAA
jgi:plasmid maintenance system antidote protein VapI